MTSEESEEAKATTDSSETRTGNEVTRERREGSEEAKATTDSSETRTGNEVTRERREGSEEAKATTEPSEHSSGERSDPRESVDGEFERSSEPSDEAAEDDIPLSIAGHEDREPPGGDDAESVSFGDADEESDADAPDDADPYPDQVDALAADEDDEDVQPVELLVQLAKNGEIDPWDIDIVHVTDAFLDALDEADLRTSGRALFYASVLLRMKSDVLFTPDEPDEEELPPWEAPFAEEGPAPEEAEGPDGFDPVERLEAEMDRRLERQHARGKPETLDELVRELRDAERGSWWKRSREYDTSNSPSGFNRGVQELSYHSGDAFRGVDEPTADDVTHTQHDEDIEDVIDAVEAALEPHYEGGREEVLFVEIEASGGSRVMTYLALLFLAHRGRVRLEQDELFGDLWVQQVTVEAEATGEAVAD
ncbi:segregation/condensation protein A [Halovivax limisalsi]|uniref:segregation/condensation protein A n=1 Tax=Halovivax limisalsi TaxID=1453760 RepID=UPI001FFC70C1|nr:segregation/condensation protein A [Halovivax limisalsi]